MSAEEAFDGLVGEVALSGVRPIERPTKKPPTSAATAATTVSNRIETPSAGMSRMSAANEPSTPTHTMPRSVTPRLAWVGPDLPRRG